MRMIGACINPDLLEHTASQCILGQHPFYGVLQCEGRLGLENPLERYLLETAGITTVAGVDLVFELVVPRNLDLFRIDDHNVITRIEMGLCFPLRIFATSLANLPRTLPSASATNHFRSNSLIFALIVFIAK